MDITSLKKEKTALYDRLCTVAKQRQANVHLLLENVDKPSNLGAIARSCDAFGIQHIGYLPSKRHVKEKRLMMQSSVSASEWLDFEAFDNTESYFEQLKKKGWFIVATSPNPNGKSLYEIDFQQYKKLAVVLGSEAQGLSDVALEKADMLLNIPTYGVTQSLNVSVATGIVLATICSQRQDTNFLLDASAQKTLVDIWFTRLAKRRYGARVEAMEEIVQMT